jgi:hypothetical protein
MSDPRPWKDVPTPWQRRGVAISTWALPRGAIRDRYRDELLAELYASPPRHRVHYTTGVLTRAWALRQAVVDDEPLAKETAMPRKPLTCRLNMHHVWRTLSTEDGNRYRRCIRCGKDLFSGHGPGDSNWAVPLG